MNDKNLHIDHEFFSNAKVEYDKSKEEVLTDLLSQIDSGKAKTVKRQLFPKYYWAAAVIVLLISTTAFLRFYTKSIKISKGDHLVFVLPDNSEVSLNSQSEITYKPFWFALNRELTLDGEAFFSVTKGEKFRVISKSGTTQVLGTSFNIFSRQAEYKVHCYTGKVKVSSPENKSVILTPDYSAEINDKGQIIVKKQDENKSQSDWLSGEFNFNSVPLKLVLKEVERQYNILIEANIKNDLIYTGHFSSSLDKETVLNLLCKPFGLKFEKINDNVYRIK